MAPIHDAVSRGDGGAPSKSCRAYLAVAFPLSCNVPSLTAADDASIMERKLRRADFEDTTSSKPFSIVSAFRPEDKLTDFMQDYIESKTSARRDLP